MAAIIHTANSDKNRIVYPKAQPKPKFTRSNTKDRQQTGTQKRLEAYNRWRKGAALSSLTSSAHSLAMPTYLNWQSGLGKITLDTTTDIFIPSQPPTYDGTTDTIDFLIKRDTFGSPILDGEGNFQYILNDSGSKVSSGTELYRTTNLADDIWVRGAIPGPGDSKIYALNLTTIRLGGGNDSLNIYGDGIFQSNTADISLASTLGYVFQSNIFGEAGDDYISVLLAWQSTIKGGTNTSYYDALNPPSTIPLDGYAVTLADTRELDSINRTFKGTLEEVPFGDTLVLKGSRADWDLEFYDGNGDGSVTLASLLDERDYIATSNNNKIWGFERLLFGDYLFDLILYRQQPSSSIYGQPEYYLFGEETAPTLNSSIGGDIWQAFRFNRTKIGGIEGAGSLYRITVSTGEEDDTPYIDGALSYADLFTGLGSDIVFARQTKGAYIDLGSGDDQLTIEETFEASELQASSGRDSIRIGKSINSILVTGSDQEDESDSIEIRISIASSTVRTGGGPDRIVILNTPPVNSLFDGGSGNGDSIQLPGSKESYQFKLAGSESLGFTLRDKNFNAYQNIESFIFGDGTISISDLILELQLSGSLLIGSGQGESEQGSAGAGGGIIVPSTSTEPQVLQLPSGGFLINAASVSSTTQTLSGSAFDDIINGGNNPDILRGKAGKDQLRGGGSNDRFQFSFADRGEFLSADRILDFTPGQDKVEILDVSKTSSLGKALKGKQASSKTVKTVATKKQAAKSKATFVYASESGELFYNQNLASSGFGKKGGLIAELTPGLPFSAGDMTIGYL
ncbi:MAG: hypothetical protein R6W06_00290 [Prochlorococcaceae cyanobacterium]